jgi:hypothetical protein
MERLKDTNRLLALIAVLLLVLIMGKREFMAFLEMGVVVWIVSAIVIVGGTLLVARFVFGIKGKELW